MYIAIQLEGEENFYAREIIGRLFYQIGAILFVN